MNLVQYISISAGGPGSGCNPAVADPGCGRPPKGGSIRTTPGGGHEFKTPTGGLPKAEILRMAEIIKKDQDARPAGSGSHNTAVRERIEKFLEQHRAGKNQPSQHVPDVQRDWRRKKFQTQPGNPAKYFRPGTFTASLFRELHSMAQNMPNEWLSLKDMQAKYNAPSFHGALFALRDAAKHTGKFTIERQGDRIRMVLTEKPDKPQAELFPDINRVNPIEKLEKHLSSDEISSAKEIGAEGGVNRGTTKILTFSNGSKAVFKYEEGNTQNHMGHQTKAELGAWQVAKAAGIADLAPAVVYRKIDGNWGAVLDWSEGRTGGQTREDRKYDGETDAKRIAMFDFIIANTDRHGGNWIVQPDGKLRMIDHGYSLTDEPNPPMQGDRIMEHLQDKKISPDEYEPYVKASVQIQDSLRALGINAKAIKNVAERIDGLASGEIFHTYEDLLDSGRRVLGRTWQERLEEKRAARAA